MTSLINKLAKNMWDNEPAREDTSWDEADDVDRHIYRVQASGALTVLAEWADGALIDPSTWQRLVARPVFAFGIDSFGQPDVGFEDLITDEPIDGDPSIYTLTPKE